jgi:hypothetical protein
MSSGKYVPPAFRNKQQDNRRPKRDWKPQWEVDRDNELARIESERVKSLEKTDVNFPSLGSGEVRKNGNWNRSFAVLATEWNQKEDEEKKKQADEKVLSEYYASNRPQFNLPHFHNVKRYIDVEEQLDTDEVQKTGPVDDWVTVERKKIRKTRANDDDESSSGESENKDETVWDQPEEYETCWDERRY